MGPRREWTGDPDVGPYLWADQYLSASACRFCITWSAWSGWTMKLPSSSTAASAISGGVASQKRLIWLYLPSMISLATPAMSVDLAFTSLLTGGKSWASTQVCCAGADIQ